MVPEPDSKVEIMPNHIVYTGSTYPSFGARAYGPNAGSIHSAHPNGGANGPVETSLPNITDRYYSLTDAETTITTNYIRLAKEVIIHNGGALIVGHNLSSSGENATNIILDFGIIRNNSKHTGASFQYVDNAAIFNYSTTPADWQNIKGFHFMTGGPKIYLPGAEEYGNNIPDPDNPAYIPSINVSFLNNGSAFIDNNITTIHSIINGYRLINNDGTPISSTLTPPAEMVITGNSEININVGKF
jgi:hypothetical protein